MDQIPNHPTAYAVIVVISTMLLTSIIQWAFLIRLRSKYSNQWIHAGSPTIWSDQSLLSAWPTIKYLQAKQYTSSGNFEGIQFCNYFRYPMVMGYWVTIFMFIGGVIIGINSGWPPSWS